MQGSTMPSRRPSRRAIRSLSPSPKALSLIVLIRRPVPHRRMTSRADRNRPQLSMFSIRCGRRSTMSPGVPSEAAGNVYSQGERYARQAREQYPEAERYIREGQQAVTHRVTESPLLALFVAGAIGYALAWLIHGQRRGPDEHVPEYGRTNQGYAPHRDEQRRH